MTSVEHPTGELCSLVGVWRELLVSSSVTLIRLKCTRRKKKRNSLQVSPFFRVVDTDYCLARLELFPPWSYIQVKYIYTAFTFRLNTLRGKIKHYLLHIFLLTTNISVTFGFYKNTEIYRNNRIASIAICICCVSLFLQPNSKK